jgi:hypothetical protein
MCSSRSTVLGKLRQASKEPSNLNVIECEGSTNPGRTGGHNVKTRMSRPMSQWSGMQIACLFKDQMCSSCIKRLKASEPPAIRTITRSKRSNRVWVAVGMTSGSG